MGDRAIGVVQQGSVGPVQAKSQMGSAEYGDLVAQDEQLNLLGRRGLLDEASLDDEARRAVPAS